MTSMQASGLESTPLGAQESRSIRSESRISWKRILGKTVLYALLVAVSLVFLIPAWWMLTTSIKDLAETFRTPPTLIPRSFTLVGYQKAWEHLPWPTFLSNTLQIVFGGLAGAILTSSLCAYGFARFRFAGRDLVFGIMLASIMLPNQVTLIPTYIFYSKLGWLNTFRPLIIPAWFGGGAFNIFLMRQFFASIPQEMVDAARVDGATRLGILWRIFLPLSKPALTVVTVFTIQSRWNDFFTPLIYLNSKSKMTMALGLQMFQQLAASGTEYSDVGLYTAMMAASTMVSVPIVVLFISAQRYFVAGIQMTGLRG